VNEITYNDFTEAIFKSKYCGDIKPRPPPVPESNRAQ
jgi:hypothetical protein